MDVQRRRGKNRFRKHGNFPHSKRLFDRNIDYTKKDRRLNVADLTADLSESDGLNNFDKVITAADNTARSASHGAEIRRDCDGD